MRLLILGGTGFLGRHLTECALKRGWDVTLFNRGQRNPGLYPNAREIHGDRKVGFEPLAGLTFDSVIDTSGFFPRDLDASASFLKEASPHYVFVSSVSAYEETDAKTLNEDSPLAPWDEAFEPLTEMKPEAYGALKAECERRVQKIYGDGALIIRPGLIVGRYDPTGRFSYWPNRFRKGGKIVVPADSGARVQIIDAMDLAGWTLDLCAAKRGGVFNGVGPKHAMTFGQLFAQLMAFAPEGTELVPLSNAFLLKHDVAPWVGLPLWLPKDAGGDGMMSVDLQRQIEAGLKHRPLADTVRDILAEIDETGTFVAGASLTAEAEAALLAAH